MSPEEKYQFWLKDAQYDIESAEHNFMSARWFYCIFMCQQAIEKLSKGLFGLYFDFNTIPFTHNIEKLIKPIATKVPVTIPHGAWDFFIDLSQYAVNKRYPDYKLLMSQKATQAEALRMFNLTKEAFTWLQTLKPSEPKPEDTLPRPRP